MNDAEWFAEHTAYLATPEWAFKRGQVLNRDGYRCQARLHGCNGEANQAHHLNYKHWRNEPLFDLIAVCWVCHEQITDMDRANRPPDQRLVRDEAPSQARSILKQVEDLLETAAPSTTAEIASFLDLPVADVLRAMRRSLRIVEVGRTEQGNRLHGLKSIGMDLPV